MSIASVCWSRWSVVRMAYKSWIIGPILAFLIVILVIVGIAALGGIYALILDLIKSYPLWGLVAVLFIMLIIMIAIGYILSWIRQWVSF